MAAIRCVLFMLNYVYSFKHKSTFHRSDNAMAISLQTMERRTSDREGKNLNSSADVV